jgi:hypothetical protein
MHWVSQSLNKEDLDLKRSFSLLLSAMLLVFALSACGRDNNSNGSTAGSNLNEAPVDPGTGSAMDDNTADDRTDANTDNHSLLEEGKEALEDGKDAVEDVVDPDHRDETVTDENATTEKQRSVLKEPTYGQMLRNAQVHDTDGDLWDHENAVSPDTKL